MLSSLLFLPHHAYLRTVPTFDLRLAVQTTRTGLRAYVVWLTATGRPDDVASRIHE